MAETSKTRQAVYAVLFVAIASLAVYRLVFGSAGPGEKLPNTPESAQPFICRNCGHVFELTPRQRAEAMARGGRIERDEETATRRVFLPCPACDAVEAVVARRCPHCGRPFMGLDKDGHRHVMCPQCEAASSDAPRIGGDR
jgi:hypothetical protein